MTGNNRPPTVEIGEDRVAVITLHRPDVLNALDSASHIAIGDAITALERDDNVGAIVIAGEGRAFCSGSDLAEIGQLTGQAEQDYVALCRRRPGRTTGAVISAAARSSPELAVVAYLAPTWGGLRAEDLVYDRFVRELGQSGYIRGLYGR